MPRAARFLIAALVATPLLLACGNKGPLVLPDQAPKKHKSAPATPAAQPQPPTGADAGH